MHIIKRSALVPFSAESMYNLVADIPRYPEFLKWCSDAIIVEERDHEVIASVTINFKGLKKSFSTKNRMHPNQMIEMSLVHGPFSHLKGNWIFTPLEASSSKIELDMDFGFDNVIVEKLVGPVFSYIANHQVDAFHQRAQQLYGERTNDQG